MIDSRITVIAKKKPLPKKAVRLGWVLFLLGILICTSGYLINPRQAAFSNVVDFLFLTSIGIGALFLISLEYVAGAVWSVPMRRVNEFVAALVPFAALLAVPIFFLLPEVFKWADLKTVATDDLLQSKQPYLNINFFAIRFAVIFGILMLFFVFLTQNSRKQDATADQKYTRWNIRISGLFMPFIAFGVTLLSIDWAMSIEPHWYSTIFGVYYFSGTVIAALAAVTYIVVRLYEHGYFPNLRQDHFYSLGALLFAFVNFWAYIAFSQFMLVWYANLPEETSWYLMRWRNGWEAVSIILILAQFWIPYFMLLSQESKMNLKRLKFVAIWLLIAHFLDMYWLVMPTYNSEVPLGLMEIGFPFLTVGLIILVLSWKMKRHNLLPIGDPKLQRGLKFHL
jgi:hypothetical protein